jgi:DNA-binding NarL/FixJ family response regulator
MRKTKILLIEDNRILREGIAAIINGQGDLKIVSMSGGRYGALDHAKEVKPQIVLMDLGLRNENVLLVLRDIRKQLPKAKVIGMGLIPSQQDVVEFIQGGAAGFILKDATIEEVLVTIRNVARGVQVIPPLLTGSLFTHVVNHALQQGKMPNAVRMTTREREIIVLVAEAMSNKEIAQKLNLSAYTVKSHTHNILEKLALHSRLEIATTYFDPRGR